MDVKNPLASILPITARVAGTSATKEIKSSQTQDRDGNGQEQYQQNKQNRPMTEDEFQKAIEILKGFSAVQENQLTVEVKEINGKRMVLLVEKSGQVLRRIHESELWSLPEFKSSESKRGQLLNKSA